MADASTPTHGHDHMLAGYQITTARGPRLRWCARCGRMGVFAPMPGRAPLLLGWVTPGESGEDELLDLLELAVERMRQVQALPAGAAIDSPEGGVGEHPKAKRPASGWWGCRD